MLRIGFLGAGNMAYALAGAVSEKFGKAEIVPFDINPARLDLFRTNFRRVRPVSEAEELAELCDLVFLSVKPQMMEEAVKPLAGYAGLIVSIAAGLKISFFEERIPSARIIRVMPNTPCLVGEMAAGYCAGSRVTEKDLSLASDILGAAGKAELVSEELIDAVTGLSGSGPAYFARLAEAFIDAGVEAGLSPELSGTPRASDDEGDRRSPPAEGDEPRGACRYGELSKRYYRRRA